METSTSLAIKSAVADITGQEIERVTQYGDLAKMSDADRARYYLLTCSSVGLNPLTKPFVLMKNQAGELFMHAGRGACEQLRKRDRVSIRIVSREKDGENYIVIAAASTPDGRVEESMAVVTIKGLTGQSLGNAFMKCETKAKNRATLSITGLGFAGVDDADPKAVEVKFDTRTGEITEPHPPARVVSLITPADISPSGADAVRENINALLSSHGMSLEDALAWWDKMTTKYGGTLTPAILTMLYDQLKAKADAMATVEAEPVEAEEEEIV